MTSTTARLTARCGGSTTPSQTSPGGFSANRAPSHVRRASASSPCAERHRLEKRGNSLRQWHEAAAPSLGQRLEKKRDLFANHSRHEPGKARRVDLVQERERHRQRQAVQRMPRREAILERQNGAGHRERFGKELLGHVRRRVAHQHVAGQEQDPRIPSFRAFPPAFEGDLRAHVLRGRARRRTRRSRPRRPARPGAAPCARAPPLHRQVAGCARGRRPWSRSRRGRAPRG